VNAGIRFVVQGEEVNTMTRRNSWFLAALLAVGGLSGCVVRSQPVGYATAEYSPGPDYAEVYVAQPPPAPVVEYPTPPPAPGFVWLQGYWDWTGYDWYWVNGYWAPQRAGYVYVAPTYHHQHGRWVYHRSHWVGNDGRRDYVYARPAPAVQGRSGGGSWRGAPAPAQGGGYPGGGYPSTAPPAAASPGGSWRASPAPAAPVGRGGGYQAPPASGTGSWRATPAPAGPSAPAPAPTPPPATASPSGGWRASPVPARPTSPTLSTPPGGIESQGRRPSWTATPTPAPAPSNPPPAGGGYNGARRIRPVAPEPAPSNQGIQPSSPPPRRASPQGQATQGGQSQPQPVQENQRARRGRPAAAQSVP
jgi:hypothetical protein